MALWLCGVLFLAGLILTLKGGDLFVDSAAEFSQMTGIPKPIVGATVVSLATTLPELLVSATATLQGAGEIAIGNGIGSVACNTGLIMGCAILWMRKKVDFRPFIPSGILLILSSGVLTYFTLDGWLSRTEGMVLAMLLGLFFYLQVSNALTGEPNKNSAPSPHRKILPLFFKLSSGTLGLVLGARLLVDNGERLALAWGIPASVVGLTLVALGTSLPELVTTLTALSKDEMGLSIGNIIGANTIDLTLILPICGLLSHAGLSIPIKTVMVDIPITFLLILIAVLPPIICGRLMRWQGGLLIFVYMSYIGFYLLV